MPAFCYLHDMQSPPKHLIQLAHQRALEGFAVLAARMLESAEQSMGQAVPGATGDEAAALAAARSLVRFDGQQLATRMREQFALLLDRAMQTMHTDLRADLRKVSIDQLSLLDDAVMVRQIGVDRLVLRLRDAEQLSFGRLNVIIAQLHGVSEVRERENPFRPYLPARALYEAVGAMVGAKVDHEARARILFDHLSAAMAAHMQAYYGPVLEVFEQRGVIGRLVARPSQMPRAERERLAWQRAAELAAQGGAAPAGIEDPALSARMRLLPRVRGVMTSESATPSAFPDLDSFDHTQALQAMVRALGARSARAEPPAAAAPGPALREALRAAQAIEPGEPLALAGRIAAHGASREQRQRLELVALVFEFMLGDSLLDPRLRRQVARLFVPFVRLVLEQPDVLRQAGDPARALIDRIGMLAASIDADTPNRAELDAVVGGAVDALLAETDIDAASFARAGAVIDAFIPDWLPGLDPRFAPCSAALLEADAVYLARAAAVERIEPLLATLRIDPRIAAFIRDSWIAVLARSAPDEPGHAALLAELVWSAQAKLDAAEHAALMRLLPGLVKRLRQGLARLDLSDAESKATLDQLVTVHMEVMANGLLAYSDALDLDALRRHFAPVDARSGAAPTVGAWPERDAVDTALARHGAHATVVATPVGGGDEAWLTAFRPGIGVEFLEGGVVETGRLIASGGAGGAWLFSVPGRAEPLVYLRGALLAALDEDTVRMREYAPLFERAVDALTASMTTLAADRRTSN